MPLRTGDAWVSMRITDLAFCKAVTKTQFASSKEHFPTLMFPKLPGMHFEKILGLPSDLSELQGRASGKQDSKMYPYDPWDYTETRLGLNTSI